MQNMQRTLELLSADQLRNYYSILEVAQERLNTLYTGQDMKVYTSGNEGVAEKCKIVHFDIVPVENGGIQMTHENDLENILKDNNVSNLVIMVRYLNRTGNEDIMGLNSFFSANSVKTIS